MNKKKARLESWYHDEDYNILWGYIYADEAQRWPDGHRIHTSTIIKIEDGVCETLNTIYTLGEPFGKAAKVKGD